MLGCCGKRLLDPEDEIRECHEACCGAASKHSVVAEVEVDWATQEGSYRGTDVVNAIQYRQAGCPGLYHSCIMQYLRVTYGMSFIAQSGLPVIFCGDVSHEAVDSEVVGYVGAAQLVDELQVEELPGNVTKEDVVDKVTETGHELSKNGQTYQEFSAISVRPGSR